MSKNELQVAVTGIGKIVGIESDSVIGSITKWNKEKAYPVSMINIDINDKGITDNAEEVGAIVGKIELFADDVVKNTLDAESVTDAKKTVAEIGKFFIETRKIVTNPLKDIASHYTKFESKFKDMNEALTKKFEEINEREYLKRAKAITEYFEELISSDEDAVAVSLDAFKDFIQTKRKINIYTSTGKLSKGIKDAAMEALRLVVEPIKQAKELEGKKALQSKQFETYFENIESDGDTPKLEASINQLVRMKESIAELYPDVKDSCLRSIDNKVSRCESNIKANKAIEERDAIKNADGDTMLVFDAINLKSKDMTKSIDELRGYADELREIYPKLTFSENQEKVKALGISISQRVTALEIAENTPDAKVINEEVILEAKYSLTAKYSISIEDIEFIASISIDANNQSEAKEKFVAMFKSHLDMIDLSKGN